MVEILDLRESCEGMSLEAWSKKPAGSIPTYCVLAAEITMLSIGADLAQ